MKKLFTLLLSVSILASFAQNWQTVNSSRTALFSYEKNNEVLFEGLRIDSIVIDGNDSIFYNYKTEYNCLDDTSWIGSQIRIDTLGNNYFYNKSGDTFCIKTLSNYGDIWNVNNTTIATNIGTGKELIFDNISDSVKYISIGNIFVIVISKNYGIIKCPRFSVFPIDYQTEIQLQGIDKMVAIHNLDTKRVFNFEIGDEFHYERKTECYPPSIEIESWTTIINQPYKTTKNDSLIELLPNENNTGKLFINYDYNNSLGTQIKTISSPTCMHDYSYKKEYAKNLGMIYSDSYNGWTNCSEVTRLVYYKKINGEEWGTPLSRNDLINNQISIYPNPATDILNISYASNTTLNLEVFNAIGELIKSTNFNSSTQLKTTDWEKGIHFLKISDQNGGLIKMEKIVIQ